jgi:hypothetical protein
MNLPPDVLGEIVEFWGFFTVVRYASRYHSMVPEHLILTSTSLQIVPVQPQPSHRLHLDASPIDLHIRRTSNINATRF